MGHTFRMNFLEQCIFKHLKSLIAKKWWFGSQAARQGRDWSSEATGALQWVPEEACRERGTNGFQQIRKRLNRLCHTAGLTGMDDGCAACKFFKHSKCSSPSNPPTTLGIMKTESSKHIQANIFGDETFACRHRAKDKQALPPCLALGSSTHVWMRDTASQDSSWPQHKALR